MKMRMIIAFALLVGSAQAQLAQDQKSQCDYLLEQAKGVADQLRIPNLISGLAAPKDGTLPQTFIGVQNSISSDRKAADTIRLATRTCALYVTTEEATLRLLYASPSLQKLALEHRATVDAVASSKLDDLVVDAQARVGSQNLPRPVLYSLESTRAKIEMDRSTSSQAAAVLYVPADMNAAPIRQLIADKQADVIATQKATERVNRTVNWDLSLEGGAHRQVSSTVTPGTSSGGLYGALTFTWGLGSRKVDKHFDKAVNAYTIWKETQEGDVIRNAAVLKQTLTNSIVVLSEEKKTLQTQKEIIESNIKAIGESDTSAGLTFSYQLNADLLALQVEIDDVNFRLDQLHTYLQENF